MPEQFKSNAGGLMAGHADKWSDKNRRPNSHNAGSGRAGSRNQGTGAAGKANTVASDSIDTTKMTPDEKLKYFKSLGLLKPQEAPQEPQKKIDTNTQPKAENPVKSLSDRLGKVFSTQPQMLQDIVKHLQSVPKEQLKQKALAVLNVMKDNSSTNPQEVHGAIMSVLKDSDDYVSKRSPITNATSYRRMTPEEFINGNDDLPKSNLLSLVKQAQLFDDVDGALYYINMARDNVDDNDDVKNIVASMHATADSLSDLGFDLK